MNFDKVIRYKRNVWSCRLYAGVEKMIISREAYWDFPWAASWRRRLFVTSQKKFIF